MIFIVGCHYLVSDLLASFKKIAIDMQSFHIFSHLYESFTKLLVSNLYESFTKLLVSNLYESFTKLLVSNLYESFTKLLVSNLYESFTKLLVSNLYESFTKLLVSNLYESFTKLLVSNLYESFTKLLVSNLYESFTKLLVSNLYESFTKLLVSNLYESFTKLLVSNLNFCNLLISFKVESDLFSPTRGCNVLDFSKIMNPFYSLLKLDGSTWNSSNGNNLLANSQITSIMQNKLFLGMRVYNTFLDDILDYLNHQK